MRDFSIAEAKDNLPRLVHEVEAGEPIRLLRYGKPVAVVLSVEEYERLANPKEESFWESLQEARAHLNPNDDYSDVFEDVRDRTLGPDSQFE